MQLGDLDGALDILSKAGNKDKDERVLYLLGQIVSFLSYITRRSTISRDITTSAFRATKSLRRPAKKPKDLMPSSTAGLLT